MEETTINASTENESAGNSQTWVVDKMHSKLGFGIKHLMISEVEGSFKNFDAKILSAKDDFSDAVVELTADINSVNTENADRDKHMLAPDFFDAEKFPALSFKSDSIQKLEDNKLKLTGQLTFHGVTKPVELNATFNGTAVNPQSQKTMAGFNVQGNIKRADFGLATGIPSAMLGETIKLNAHTQFYKN